MTFNPRAVPRSIRPQRPQRSFLTFGLPIIAAVVILLLLTVPGLVGLLVNYWWFNELGASQVFTTQLWAAIGLGVGGTIVAALILKGLAFFVVRVARRQGRAQAYRGAVRLGVNAAIAVLALLSGLGLASNWQTALFALHQQSFGRRDPVFGHDIAFYVFTLPLLDQLRNWAAVVLLVGLVVGLALLYALDIGGRVGAILEPYVRTGQVVGVPEFDIRWLRPYLTVVSFWLSLAALLVAASNWLIRYVSVVSPGNGFQGASYVDLNAGIPGWTILAVLAAIGAIVFLVNAFVWRRWSLIGAVPAVWLVAWAVLVVAYPLIVQTLKVNPAPLAAEQPQITRNIMATRQAFGLNTVAAAQAPAGSISASQIAAARGGVNSLRVEDPDQFMVAASQQQAIRTFYDFPTVGLDRYKIGGTVRQVLVAPRELNQDQLPGTAKTWQNLNFAYTHGYGAVVAPVNTTTADGFPQYLIENIPPQQNANLPASTDLPAITRPEIYYGLDTNTSVFVDSTASEFDYGTVFQDHPYAGSAGITIGGFLKRLAWVVYFASPIQIGTTSYLTPSSRVLLHRNIVDRLTTLAPFFTYDSDPYLVLANNGRLTWMVDGYTTTTNYPYAEPYSAGGAGPLSGASYVRNAVKATIDAYDGAVHLYISDPNDAIVKTVAASFPGLLRPLSAMPSALRAHIRYPEDLFAAQSQMYTRYHQTDALTWYNNNDQWSVSQIPDANGANQRVAPYYSVTRLPGGSTDEFVITQLYNPIGKNNLVSILVGRSDAPHYGQLVSYVLPLGALSIGPQQFQANVQQNQAWSPDLSLWDQHGSTVHFGNISVVPIGSGLLYLEPLFLQAEASKIPQLVRVIVYANGKLVWGSSIANALDQIFGHAAPPPSPAQANGTPTTATPAISSTSPITGSVPITSSAPITSSDRQVLQQIQNDFVAEQKAYARGDYAAAGQYQAAAQRLLQQALSRK